MNVACGHYKVKIVLIGKNRCGHCPHAANRAGFVALEFILNEPRGIMVNRALPAPIRAGRYRRSARHEPDLKSASLRTSGLGLGDAGATQDLSH
jgi:hypothetical protein